MKKFKGLQNQANTLELLAILLATLSAVLVGRAINPTPILEVYSMGLSNATVRVISGACSVFVGLTAIGVHTTALHIQSQVNTLRMQSEN